MKTLTCLLVLGSALLQAGSANGDIHHLPERLDLPVNVTSAVAYDSAKHLYTYTYTVANPAANPRPIEYFSILFQPGVDVITEVVSPTDWTSHYSEADGLVRWAGTEITNYIPADYVDDGHSIAPYGPWIQPGGSMTGFSFKSFSPPGTGTGISQNFAPLPWADDAGELEGLPYSSSLPEDNGFRFQTTTPIPDADWSGNRRPTVDGFLVFANAQPQTTYTGYVLIVVRFAAGGENVNTDSFRATLNSFDVTGQFAYSAAYKGYAATFLLGGGSPLSVGNNVLLTTVQGTIPGVIDKPTKDTDRLAFKFSQ